jgi:predicted metalloprotease with PDZ domain
MEDFFQNYVLGTESVDYSKFLKYAGLEISDLNAGSPVPELGIRTTYNNGRLTVTGVIRGSAAYKTGINVNDEIIAVNNVRISSDFNDMIRTSHSPGDTIKLLISRGDVILHKKAILQASDQVNYSIFLSSEINQCQKIVREKWITGHNTNY